MKFFSLFLKIFTLAIRLPREPFGRIALELVSSKHNVECAAVERCARFHLLLLLSIAPQLVMILSFP